MRKGNAVAALALCYFVLMVREYEVLTAAMNIDGLAEKTSYHCRALNMPARSAVTPWWLPIRLARLRALPKCKVHRLFFKLLDIYSRAGLKVLKRLMRKLTVFLKFGRAEVHITVWNGICIALFDKSRNDIDYLVDIFGGTRKNGLLNNINTLCVCPIL